MTDKQALIQPDKGQSAISLHLVDKAGLEDFTRTLSAPQRAALAAQKFEAEGYSHAIVPDGDSWFVVAGVANAASLSSWCLAKLAEVLPAGTYRRVGGQPGPALFGWVSGQYRFDRYRSEPGGEGPRVLLTSDARAIDPVLRETAAVALVRDMVNTPAEDMGPAEIEAAAERIAKAHHANVKITRGDALERGFPMVHMVGRAASRHAAPRMIELEWGDDAHPRLAIVGKGVCFDSGGLDLKPSSAMLLMKKDMGGAAQRLPARRCPAFAQRAFGRDRQYRRGRASRAGRRTGPRGRGQARPHDRFRHADRRCPRRAGA
jgi:leucyl aminopeptidase